MNVLSSCHHRCGIQEYISLLSFMSGYEVDLCVEFNTAKHTSLHEMSLLKWYTQECSLLA